MKEHRRVPPDVGPWREQHRVTAVYTTADGSRGSRIGLAFQFGVHVATTGARAASFQAAVEFDLGLSQPILLATDEIPMPVNGWEFRTSGLWADHNCETAFEHWSYGLEAFALGIEDRAELLGRGYGDRTPLGWELDFEARFDLTSVDPVATSLEGYAQTGRLHGIIQFVDGEVEIDGPATRWHWWGVGAMDGSPLLGVAADRTVALPTPDGVWWVDPLRIGSSSSPNDEGSGR
ncbi:MAG: hypothetical protein ACR2QO_28435 [Acidimicrobiales bacterium]